jgi:hypothetical protein
VIGEISMHVARPAFRLAARTMSYLSNQPTPEQVERHAEYAEMLRIKRGFEFRYCPANRHYAWKSGSDCFSEESLVRGYLNLSHYLDDHGRQP